MSDAPGPSPALPAAAPRSRRARAAIVLSLLGAHAALYAVTAALGEIRLPGLLGQFLTGRIDRLGFVKALTVGEIYTQELFGVVLLLANVIIAAILLRGAWNLLLGAGAMFLIGAHAFIGQRLAPDALTSGALLVVNILVLYVGVRLYTRMPARHWYAFAASYFALFLIFVRIKWAYLVPGLRLTTGLSNAEPLFLLFLLGLCACARSFRLLAYFWAVTLSFTFAQPYAWEATVASVFLLAALFGARGTAGRPAALVFLGAGLALALLVLFPVIAVIMGEDLHNVGTVLGDARIRAAVGRTLLTATCSTAFLIALAVPLAYALSRLRFPGRTLLLSAIDVPIVIPQSVAGLALVSVFGGNQPLGEAVHRVLGVSFDGTLWGVCLAQVFVAMPFIVKASVAAFDAVPEELELAARTLGASSWGAWRRVALPLASRGIFLGAILAWARAAGEFGALLFIAATPETAPVAAWNRFNSMGVAEAGPLVAVLLAFSLVMFFLLQLAARALPKAAADRTEARP